MIGNIHITRQVWVKKSDLKIFEIDHVTLKGKSICIPN